MTQTIRTVLCLLGAGFLLAAAGGATAGADELPAASVQPGHAAGALPVSGPRNTSARPTAGAVPVAGRAQAQRNPVHTKPAPKPTPAAGRSARSPKRAWPEGARPFVPAGVTAKASRPVRPAPASAGAVPPAPASARRTVQAPARPTRTAARARTPSAPRSAALRAPEVRHTSPSYAELARSQPTHLVRRPQGTARTATPRRAARRTTPARRIPAHQARSSKHGMSIPLAPGEQPRPVPTRRRMELRFPPGCCGGG